MVTGFTMAHSLQKILKHRFSQ